MGNSAVKHLWNKKHNGKCFRVHGGHSGPEQGILIHEAPNVGWLIGCISPRPLKNFTTEFANQPGNPSNKCMEELFRFVGGQGDLFVLDWYCLNSRSRARRTDTDAFATACTTVSGAERSSGAYDGPRRSRSLSGRGGRQCPRAPGIVKAAKIRVSALWSGFGCISHFDRKSLPR
jgi:hypothetical protein